MSKGTRVYTRAEPIEVLKATRKKDGAEVHITRWEDLSLKRQVRKSWVSYRVNGKLLRRTQFATPARHALLEKEWAESREMMLAEGGTATKVNEPRPDAE